MIKNLQNQMKYTRRVELKPTRFGNVEYDRADLKKIQMSYNPALPDPKSLQQFVWFNIMLYLICH